MAVRCGIPFVTIYPAKIVGVNYCVFALCQADSSKGVAEPQPPTQKQGPNAESLYDFWYGNFDCKLDRCGLSYSGLDLIWGFWPENTAFVKRAPNL